MGLSTAVICVFIFVFFCDLKSTFFCGCRNSYSSFVPKRVFFKLLMGEKGGRIAVYSMIIISISRIAEEDKMLIESIGGCVQIKVTTRPHTECSDDKTKQTNKAGFHSRCFDTIPNFDTVVSITMF